MPDLRKQLQSVLTSRVGCVGLGNVALGDDGFGVRLAERLREAEGAWLVSLAGTTPERHLAQWTAGRLDHVLFLDAVEFGGAPGEVVLLDAGGMANRFPQVSTHKLSLGMLARLIESNGRSRAWLLGVQPQSLKAGAGLSPAVQTTLDLLVTMMMQGKVCEAAC